MQVSLAWCIAKGVIPIAGVSKFEQAEELVGIFKVNLTEDDIKYLERAISRQRLGKSCCLSVLCSLALLIVYLY